MVHVAKLLAGVMLFFPALCFGQTAGNIPASGNHGLCRIQVGAFQDTVRAEAVFNTLRNAGLSPVYEHHAGYRRVVLPGINTQNLPFMKNILNNAGFRNIWVRREADAVYRIQVGAFMEAANAERAINTLRNGGLNPVHENYKNYLRVVLTNINIRQLSSVLNVIYSTGFNNVWLMEEPPSSKFTVVVRGNATVDEIQDTGSTAPLRIVQTIPSFVLTDSDRTYSANAPLVFFFDDKIYLHSLTGNIFVTADGKPVNGAIVINEGANGFAVLTFTPDDPLPAGREISVVMGQGLQNAGGNRMPADVGLSFIAEHGSETDFSGNYGFELGDKGVVFTGDGAIGKAKGPLVPFEGNHYAAISTGRRLVSDNVAIGNRSSQIQAGPILEPFSTLSFHYNFISSEFNDYVGSRFDDTAMVTIYGPNGTHTEIINTVNMTGYDNTPFAGYPGMPDDGDSYAGQTGWLNYRMENIDVGTPAFIIFTVTDVGDDAFSSILAVDAIELGR